MAMAAVVLALVAAACGSDSTTTTTAATTGATTATTGGGGATTTTSAQTSKTLKVDTSKCPAEATKPLAAGEDIRIGITLPQSGQLAAFGVIGQGMKMYFDKINAEE